AEQAVSTATAPRATASAARCGLVPGGRPSEAFSTWPLLASGQCRQLAELDVGGHAVHRHVRRAPRDGYHYLIEQALGGRIWGGYQLLALPGQVRYAGGRHAYRDLPSRLDLRDRTLRNERDHLPSG